MAFISKFLVLLLLTQSISFAQTQNNKTPEVDGEGYILDPNGKRIIDPKTGLPVKKTAPVDPKKKDSPAKTADVDKKDPFLTCPFEASQSQIDQILPSDMLTNIQTFATTLEQNAAAKKDSNCQNLGFSIGELTKLLAPKKAAQDKPAPTNNSSGEAPSEEGFQPPNTQISQPDQNIASGSGAGGPDCKTDPAQCLTRLQDILAKTKTCSQEKGGIAAAVTGLAVKLSPMLGPAGSMIALGASTLKSIFELFKSTKTKGEKAAGLLSDTAKERISANLDANLACMANKVFYNTSCVAPILTQINDVAPGKPSELDGVTCDFPKEAIVLTTLDKSSVTAVYDCLISAKKRVKGSPKPDEALEKANKQCFACITTAPSEDNPRGIITPAHIGKIDADEVAVNAAAYQSVNEGELPVFMDFARQYHKDKVGGLLKSILDTNKAAVERNLVPSKMQNEKILLIQHCQRSYLTQYTEDSKIKKKILGRMFSGRKFKDLEGYKVDNIKKDVNDPVFAAQCLKVNQCLESSDDDTRSLFTVKEYESDSNGQSLELICEALHQIEKKSFVDRDVASMEKRISKRKFDGSACKTAVKDGTVPGGSTKQ